MTTRNNHAALVSLLFALISGSQVCAQMTVTGTITGTIKDPSGQVIVGANVALASEATGETRSTTTNEVGAFIFPAIPPGGYSLKVEAAGFKTFQRTGMVLSANERLALGDIQTSIGAVSEVVSVVAQGASVQTASSEQSASITSQQIEELQVRGRDIPSLLKLIPGVQWMGDPDSPGGEFGSNTPNIRGMSALVNTIAVDGVVSNDIGWSRTFSSVTTMDAIGEVKVILNGYQAEYQGNGSAVMEVVSKSGGTEFHGSGYWYKRHEMLNANNFFNNRSDVSKPLYRSDALGFSLGGPIYIPGKFNRKKNWLFGFYNLEAWKIKYPGSLQRITTPTSLERAGDFSQTLDVSGKLIPIKDPTNGQSFPGNRLPLNRINPNGLALLNILPLPNFTDRNISKGNYNYQFQESLLDPKRSQLFRIDVVPSATDRFYVRGKTWISEQEGYNVSSGASPWGLFGQCYCFTESGLGVGWTHIFTPMIVMEFTSGARHNHEGWRAYGPPDEINKILKSKVGFNLGQWYPEQNPSGFIPQVSFGGVPNSADITYNNRLLTNGFDTTFTFNDNVTVIRGPHTFKAGISANILRESEGEQSVFAGSFNFARNTNNPFDSNWAYSNALLGNFNTYQESNARYGPRERQKIVEWFVQDTWKVNRKLTVDYGIRFSWSNQMYPNIPGQQSVLSLGRYNPSQAPLLYRPAFGPNKVRMGQQPMTGELVSAVLIGAFVPNTGNPGNGGVLSGDATYPRGFVNQQPVLLGPRLGFAYDPFGKGKTAIRAGAAILYVQRLMKASQTVGNPPAIFTPILSYGQLDTYLQSAGVLAPSNTNTYNVDNKTPAAYNLTFGVQQDLSHSIMLDVSYAGVLGRHLNQTVDLNAVPYGARFLPQNGDPTSPGKPLPDNFFRPYPGYNGITLTDNAYSSNYHALLVSVNRRFTRGVLFGLAYAYSKYMDYTGIPTYQPIRVWSYGKDSSDQTHNMTVNFTWDVPKASRLLPNPVVRHVLDDWHLSGIASFVSGQPAGIGLATTDGADITGGGDGARTVVTGKATLPSGDRSFYKWFNTSVFARPAMGTSGNAPKDVIRGPGVNNWDLSLFKKFPLKGEKRSLQFRWEAYNAFNHTQYGGVNTSARFDPQGNQVNGLFGQVTSARSARVMQGSLRFTF